MSTSFGTFGDILGEHFEPVAVSLLRAGVSVRFRASGGSMHPLIADGEIISVHPTPSADLRVGDVALVAIANRIIAHRIVRRPTPEDAAFILRGDAMDEVERIAPEQILGRVEGVSMSPARASARRWLYRARNWFSPGERTIGQIERVGVQ